MNNGNAAQAPIDGAAPNNDPNVPGIVPVDDLPYGPADPNEEANERRGQEHFMIHYGVAADGVLENVEPADLNYQRAAVFYLVAARRVSDDQVISDETFDNINEAIRDYLEWDVIEGIPDQDLPVQRMAHAIYNHVEFVSKSYAVQDGNPYHSAWSLRCLKMKLFSCAFANIRAAIHFADTDLVWETWVDAQAVVMRAINDLDVDDCRYIFVDNW